MGFSQNAIIKNQEHAIKEFHVDWGTSTYQVNATHVPIVNSGAVFTGGTVNAVLLELDTNMRDLIAPTTADIIKLQSDVDALQELIPVASVNNFLIGSTTQWVSSTTTDVITLLGISSDAQSLQGRTINNSGTTTSDLWDAAEAYNRMLYLSTLGMTWVNPIITSTDEIYAIATHGFRYMAASNGATWTEGYIYEYNSNLLTWLEIVPQEGMTLYRQDTGTFITAGSGGVWGSLEDYLTIDAVSLQGRTIDDTYYATTSLLWTSYYTKYTIENTQRWAHWQNQVNSITSLIYADPSPGQRYIAADTAGGWTQNHIYTYLESSWADISPADGFTVYVFNLGQYYMYSGGSWRTLQSEFSHNGLASLNSGAYYHVPAYVNNKMIIGTSTSWATATTTEVKALLKYQEDMSTDEDKVYYVGRLALGGQTLIATEYAGFGHRDWVATPAVVQDSTGVSNYLSAGNSYFTSSSGIYRFRWGLEPSTTTFLHITANELYPNFPNQYDLGLESFPFDNSYLGGTLYKNNNSVISWRNYAGTNGIEGIKVDTNDQVVLGSNLSTSIYLTNPVSTPSTSAFYDLGKVSIYSADAAGLNTAFIRHRDLDPTAFALMQTETGVTTLSSMSHLACIIEPDSVFSLRYGNFITSTDCYQFYQNRFQPVNDNYTDLGANNYNWKDIYFRGSILTPNATSTHEIGKLAIGSVVAGPNTGAYFAHRDWLASNPYPAIVQNNVGKTSIFTSDHLNMATTTTAKCFIFQHGDLDTIYISNTALYPKQDNAIDLGTPTYDWKDLYIQGRFISPNVATTHELGKVSFGNVTLGPRNYTYFGHRDYVNFGSSAYPAIIQDDLGETSFYSSEDLVFTCNTTAAIITFKHGSEDTIRIEHDNFYPAVNGSYSLGIDDYHWKDLYLNGNIKNDTDMVVSVPSGKNITLTADNVMISAPTLKGNITTSGQNIMLTGLSSGAANLSGIQIRGTCSTTFSALSTVYLSSTTHLWEISSFNDPDTKPAMGIVLEEGTENIPILLYGLVTVESDLDGYVGTILYLDDGTVGLSGEPTTTGQVIQMLGVVTSTNSFFFNPCWKTSIV